jgi:hypothetical protein
VKSEDFDAVSAVVRFMLCKVVDGVCKARESVRPTRFSIGSIFEA